MFECSGKGGKLLRHSYPKICPGRGKLRASTEQTYVFSNSARRIGSGGSGVLFRQPDQCHIRHNNLVIYSLENDHQAEQDSGSSSM